MYTGHGRGQEVLSIEFSLMGQVRGSFSHVVMQSSDDRTVFCVPFEGIDVL